MRTPTGPAAEAVQRCAHELLPRSGEIAAAITAQGCGQAAFSTHIFHLHRPLLRAPGGGVPVNPRRLRRLARAPGEVIRELLGDGPVDEGVARSVLGYEVRGHTWPSCCLRSRRPGTSTRHWTSPPPAPRAPVPR